MKQRVSLITLGVADLGRARAFYEDLGWETGAGDEDDVVFFQAGEMVLALWDRRRLAEDSGARDGGGWGGYSGVFADPDGHPWEIAHNPHWTVTGDGGVRLG
jgi:catechol 2,3-dioxygenase-like lactoylglutathione lyase family enzyme